MALLTIDFGWFDFSEEQARTGSFQISVHY